MKILKPKHTKISMIIALEDGLLILEDHWKYPRLKSNLYKVDHELREVWEATLLGGEDDFYSNLWIEGDKLKVYLSPGNSGTLDPKTGQLSDLEFIK